MASDDDEEIRRTGLGSRAEWHPDTVSRLIDGYGEKCANIKGYLKTKDWEEIVKYVNIQCEGSKIPKTMKQCREKIDSLKRRYKMEKRRAEIRGSSHVEWSFFEKLDDIMRNLRRTGNVSEGQSFEVTEALDFEVAEPVGFDGDSRLNFVISKSADRGKSTRDQYRLDPVVVGGLDHWCYVRISSTNKSYWCHIINIFIEEISMPPLDVAKISKLVVLSM